MDLEGLEMQPLLGGRRADLEEEELREKTPQEGLATCLAAALESPFLRGTLSSSAAPPGLALASPSGLKLVADISWGRAAVCWNWLTPAQESPLLQFQEFCTTPFIWDTIN